VIGDKVIVDAVVVRWVAQEEFSRARAERVPPPWSALRGTALAASA
jgi:hypothetical protein